MVFFRPKMLLSSLTNDDAKRSVSKYTRSFMKPNYRVLPTASCQHRRSRCSTKVRLVFFFAIFCSMTKNRPFKALKYLLNRNLILNFHSKLLLVSYNYTQEIYWFYKKKPIIYKFLVNKKCILKNTVYVFYQICCRIMP